MGSMRPMGAEDLMDAVSARQKSLCKDAYSQLKLRISQVMPIRDVRKDSLSHGAFLSC